MVRPWVKKKIQKSTVGTIRPTHNRILVRLDKPAEYTGGGIFIPGGIEEDRVNARGTIVRVGPGKNHPRTGELVPMDSRLVPNARIVFGKYAGTEIGIDGEEHRIIPDSDVIGILDDEVKEAADPADSWKIPAEAQGDPEVEPLPEE